MVNVLLVVLIFPTIAFAQQDQLTRRDGFMLLWNAIHRPAYETQYASFGDLQEGDYGHLEITWAKRRKILEESESFHPEDTLSAKDALLWLFRTRNVKEITDMEMSDLPQLLDEYPVFDASRLSENTITLSDLSSAMQKLDTLLRKQEHHVSFYGEDFHGKGTAFGETFDMHALTAAHRSLPYDTLVKVTNQENGKSVVVRINDRGPYIEGRSLDLSQAAFEAISPLSRGVLTATIERLGDVDLVDACSERPQRFQQRITRDVRFFRGVPHHMNLGTMLHLQSTRYFVVRSVLYPDGFLWRAQQ